MPKEVAQISTGPGDLLWALLWDGNLLVRTGLSLDSPTGQHPLNKSFFHICSIPTYMIILRSVALFCCGQRSK